MKLWSIWNEPNHPDFLGPQYRKGTPHTPRLYRRLYVAGERAIHETPGHRGDKVLFGETAPIGNENVVSPLAFFRGALCLDRDYKKKAGCGKLRMAGVAHHAYTRRPGPSFVSEDTDEVSIGSLGRLSRALDKAARARAIDKNRGIYLTEFGIQSWPDKLGGVKPARQAEFLAIAEKMAYANPRVRLFSQYLLRDDQPRKGTRLERYSGFESGLRTSSGRKKPAYNGVHAPARRQALRQQRRPLGARPARDRPDERDHRAQGRQGEVEAPDRAPDRRRLRPAHVAPRQAALPRRLDAPGRQHGSPARRSVLTER